MKIKLLYNFECGELLLYVPVVVLPVTPYVIVGKIKSQVIAFYAAVSKL